MPQSLSNILVHVVFSTKDRHPWLKTDIRNELYAYMAGIVRQAGCEAYRVGGVEDHLHLAARLSRTITVSELVKELKISSTRWLKEQDPRFRTFAWQNGYGVFSLGASQRDSLLKYIGNQEEHHRTITFQDEYRNLLKKYGIEFDERYVWD